MNNNTKARFKQSTKKDRQQIARLGEIVRQERLDRGIVLRGKVGNCKNGIK